MERESMTTTECVNLLLQSPPPLQQQPRDLLPSPSGAASPSRVPSYSSLPLTPCQPVR